MTGLSRRIGALSRAIGSAAGGLMRLTRRLFVRDPAMDALNRQIAANRARHAPVADLLAAKTALVHDRLRGCL